jgi:hypothetical protein
MKQELGVEELIEAEDFQKTLSNNRRIASMFYFVKFSNDLASSYTNFSRNVGTPCGVIEISGGLNLEEKSGEIG